jgi:hypothetical protein
MAKKSLKQKKLEKFLLVTYSARHASAIINAIKNDAVEMAEFDHFLNSLSVCKNAKNFDSEYVERSKNFVESYASPDNENDLRPNHMKVGKIETFEGKRYLYGYTSEGMCFKDEEIYLNRPDEICYIPESTFIDCDKDDNGSISSDDAEFGGYSHNSILDLCDGNENLAKVVFDTIEWQCPETYYNELLDSASEEELEMLKNGEGY